MLAYCNQIVNRFKHCINENKIISQNINEISLEQKHWRAIYGKPK